MPDFESVNKYSLLIKVIKNIVVIFDDYETINEGLVATFFDVFSIARTRKECVLERGGGIGNVQAK